MNRAYIKKSKFPGFLDNAMPSTKAMKAMKAMKATHTLPSTKAMKAMKATHTLPSTKAMKAKNAMKVLTAMTKAKAKNAMKVLTAMTKAKAKKAMKAKKAKKGDAAALEKLMWSSEVLRSLHRKGKKSRAKGMVEQALEFATEAHEILELALLELRPLSRMMK